jgi:serine/threonine-protein kinase HipA
MNPSENIILVYADWGTADRPSLMGKLTATPIRGKEIFAFEYAPEWLANHPMQLDPDLNLYSGRQFLSDQKPNFGLFMDSSPDRWGRLLMRRREAALAKKEGRKEKTLFESDYLLGVYDVHRMGGLRFKTNAEGPFLNHNPAMAAPPFTSLRELEQASLVLEKEDSNLEHDYWKWLNLLIAPGSSLGGARPKASVVDTAGNLWIAKFPSRFDEYNMGAWEMVLHDLAKKSGIEMADAFTENFSGRHSTFLTQRFDRKGQNRIHFASAMTLLGYSDGADFHDGASYLELAEFIMRKGSEPEKDLEELWRRIVFHIFTSNTDDHLRNHGFLLGKKGWRLSPAYDLNPNPNGTGLKLNISETDNALDPELALSVSGYFRLSNSNALEILETVKKACAQWRSIAQKYKISHGEQEEMSKAFSAQI